MRGLGEGRGQDKGENGTGLDGQKGGERTGRGDRGRDG